MDLKIPAERQFLPSAGHSRWWGNLALALVSLALVWLVLEAAAGRILRHRGPKFPPSFLAGNFPLNSLHLRDFEYSPEKPPGVFRILVVGDSFTQGAGVPFGDSYPKRLERALNFYGDPGKTLYQVLNAGVSQRSTPEEVRTVKRLAKRFDPDLIIVGYCLNDAEDWADRAGIEALRTRSFGSWFKHPRGVRGLLYRHSAVIRLVAQRLFNARSTTHHVKYYTALYGEGYSGWRRTRKAFSELSAFSREREIPVLVMIFPLFSFGLGEDYPLAAVHRQVQQTLREAGIPFLDLREAYRDLPRLRLEAIPFLDPHPDEIAHRIATDALLSRLLESRLVPDGRSVSSLGRRGPAPGTPFDPAGWSGRSAGAALNFSLALGTMRDE